MRSHQQDGWKNVNSLKWKYEASSNIEIAIVTLVFDDQNNGIVKVNFNIGHKSISRLPLDWVSVSVDLWVIWNRSKHR